MHNLVVVIFLAFLTFIGIGGNAREIRVHKSIDSDVIFTYSVYERTVPVTGNVEKIYVTIWNRDNIPFKTKIHFDHENIESNLNLKSAHYIGKHGSIVFTNDLDCLTINHQQYWRVSTVDHF